MESQIAHNENNNNNNRFTNSTQMHTKNMCIRGALKFPLQKHILQFSYSFIHIHVVHCTFIYKSIYIHIYLIIVEAYRDIGWEERKRETRDGAELSLPIIRYIIISSLLLYIHI